MSFFLLDSLFLYFTHPSIIGGVSRRYGQTNNLGHHETSHPQHTEGENGRFSSEMRLLRGRYYPYHPFPLVLFIGGEGGEEPGI